MSRFWRKIVTIYAFVVFLLSAVVLAIPLSLVFRLLWGDKEKRRFQFHRIFSNYLRWLAFHIPGVKTSVLNPHGETFDQPAVIICNHQSHLDLLLTMMLSPRIVAMTNQWVWNFPLYAPILRYLEFYPAADGIETNLDHMRSLVERGYSLLIFPEGTRSADCEILRFHRGAFYLAEQLNLDIVPLFLVGPGKVLPKTDFTLMPGELKLIVGERVAASDQNYGENYREKTRNWHQYYIQRWKDLNA